MRKKVFDFLGVVNEYIMSHISVIIFKNNPMSGLFGIHIFKITKSFHFKVKIESLHPSS
jgi:hypothetical protein